VVAVELFLEIGHPSMLPQLREEHALFDPDVAEEAAAELVVGGVGDRALRAEALSEEGVETGVIVGEEFG
jgi:hypothetical protein